MLSDSQASHSFELILFYDLVKTIHKVFVNHLQVAFGVKTGNKRLVFYSVIIIARYYIHKVKWNGKYLCLNDLILIFKHISLCLVLKKMLDSQLC